jgi:hypothetical protein
MNLLLINPYDYKTVQSNPGLLSLLRVLEIEQVPYEMTVAGPAGKDGFKYLEMSGDLVDTGSNHAEYLYELMTSRNFTHLIAIDPEGATIALRLLELAGDREFHCSYISYEILFRDETVSAREQRLKERDLAYLKRCREVLIQDKVRGQMFLDEVGLDLPLYFAPVAPLQFLGTNASKDDVKKGLGLPLDKKILIYSGSLSPYAKPDWWIRIAEGLTQDYIFLFTCFDGRQFLDPSMARIGRVLSSIGNTLFIQKELPADQYMQLLRICDVGLALFRPVYTHWMNGRNISQIGLSSGKFCNYVSCCLPVICDNDQDQFRKLAADYPVVQTVSVPEDVPASLKAISEMAGESEAQCSKLFREILNPYNGIKKYLDALSAPIKRTRPL